MLYVETYKRDVFVSDMARFGSRYVRYLRYPGESDYQAQMNAVAKFNRRYAPVVSQTARVDVTHLTTGDN